MEIGLGVGTIFGLFRFSRLPHFCSGGAMAALATSPPSKIYVARCGLKRLIWPEIPVDTVSYNAPAVRYAFANGAVVRLRVIFGLSS